MEGVTPAALPAVPDLPALGADAVATDARARERAAIDFESVLASQMLKEMRQTLEPGGLFGESTSDVYGGLFDLFLGQHIAESGGLGIARMVSAYLNSRQ